MSLVERGDANGIDLLKLAPGTVPFHEAVDRASVQQECWHHVVHHMAILTNSDLFWKAAVIDRLMQDFYKELSDLHFET